MMHLFANYDPYAEVWVGKVEGLPIQTEAATLDDLLAKVWVMIRDVTEDSSDSEPRGGGVRLVVTVESDLLETMHLMRSPANAQRLNDAIADIAAGKVIKRDL